MPTNACPYRRGIRTVLRTALLLLIGLAPCWASDETAGTKTAGKSEALTRLLAGLKAAGASQIVPFHVGHAHRNDARLARSDHLPA